LSLSSGIPPIKFRIHIPDVAFRYTGSQWIFNMATTNLNQGSTYTFRINLAYQSIIFKVGVK